MNSHKKSEKFYLTRFKELCPEFPNGKIVDSERSPDFLVHSPHGTVGIELTALYGTDSIRMKKRKTFSLQAIEQEREKIVDRIKNYYIDMGGGPLRAFFIFSGNAIDKNSIKDRNCEAIAVLIKKYQPDIGNTVYFPECLKRDKDYPDWLDSVLISALNQNEENFWTAAYFGKVPKISPMIFRKKLIKRKKNSLAT